MDIDAFGEVPTRYKKKKVKHYPKKIKHVHRYMPCYFKFRYNEKHLIKGTFCSKCGKIGALNYFDNLYNKNYECFPVFVLNDSTDKYIGYNGDVE